MDLTSEGISRVAMPEDQRVGGKRRNCPSCGSYVPPGKTRCENGHECVWNFTSPEYLLKTCTPGSGPAPSKGHDLLECSSCKCLVESFHPWNTSRGVSCPSCGKALGPLIGREVDGYRIDELLGVGGFGFVYLVSSVAQPEMKEVLKILRPSLAREQPEFIKIFLEEARHTEAIGRTCFNIVRVWNVSDVPWPHFLMEYVRGTTLADLIRETRPAHLPMEQCAGFLRGMARALAATHSSGRIHRDFKPLNIMVMSEADVAEPENRIKVLDFGLSMEIGGVASTGFAGIEPRRERSPIEQAATLEYTPPEFYDGIQRLESDIYSFGVSAYEVLTGERPWKDPEPGRSWLIYWRNCHRKRQPQSIRSLRSDVPKWLATLVTQCLEKDPAKRIQTAGELLRRLRKPTPRWVWAAGAASAVLLGVLVYFALFRAREVTVEGWDVPGLISSTSSTLDLFVRDEKDLAAREVFALVRKGQRGVKGAAPSDSRIQCDVVDGSRVRARFPPSRDLLGGSFSIRGKGDGFKYHGVIRVHQDMTPPEVGEVGFVSSESAARVEPLGPRPRRFHPAKVKLLAKVVEANLASAVLESERWEERDEQWRPAQPIQSLKETVGGDEIFTFPLRDLEEGKYEGWINAEDKAKNLGKRGPVTFIIDKDVRLVVLQLDTPSLWRGKAHYDFRLEEEVQEIKVARGDSGEIISSEVLRGLKHPGTPLTASALVPGNPYVLAIPVTRGGPTKFLLRAADLATPPNETNPPLELLWTEPVALAKMDLKEVRIEFKDGGPAEPLERKEDKEDFEFWRKRPSSSPFIESLGVKLRRNRVQRAEVRLNDGRDPKVVEADPESVEFTGLVLAENQKNVIHLTFRDPLDDSLEARVLVTVDRQPPTIKVHSESTKSGRNPRYHQVESAGDVQLVVEADEEISRFQYVLTHGGVEHRGTWEAPEPKRRSPRWIYDINLGSLGIEEEPEPYRLQVTAFDLAGNGAAGECAIVLNSGPPKAKPVTSSRKPGKRLFVDTDDFRFTAKDPNEVAWERARLWVELRESVAKDPQSLLIESPPAGQDVATVSLGDLPERCEGRFILEIADRLGLSTKVEWAFLKEMERWPPIVVDENTGLVWIKVSRLDGRFFYMTRTEISNGVFRSLGIKHDLLDMKGNYRREGLKHPRPRYWLGDRHLPYKTDDGVLLPSKQVDRLPFSGVSPAEAEALAERLEARLPSREEYQAAIEYCKHLPGPDDWVNCFENPAPNLIFEYQGKTLRHRYVAVDHDPFANEADRKNRKNRFLHLRGNAEEIATLPGGGYAIIGGSFNTSFNNIEREVAYLCPDANYQGPRTGFRLVIDVDPTNSERVPEWFRDAIEKSHHER